jgi:hypothetical protein
MLKSGQLPPIWLWAGRHADPFADLIANPFRNRFAHRLADPLRVRCRKGRRPVGF